MQQSKGRAGVWAAKQVGGGGLHCALLANVKARGMDEVSRYHDLRDGPGESSVVRSSRFRGYADECITLSHPYTALEPSLDHDVGKHRPLQLAPHCITSTNPTPAPTTATQPVSPITARTLQ